MTKKKGSKLRTNTLGSMCTGVGKKFQGSLACVSTAQVLSSTSTGLLLVPGRTCDFYPITMPQNWLKACCKTKENVLLWCGGDRMQSNKNCAISGQDHN